MISDAEMSCAIVRCASIWIGHGGFHPWNDDGDDCDDLRGWRRTPWIRGGGHDNDGACGGGGGSSPSHWTRPCERLRRSGGHPHDGRLSLRRSSPGRRHQLTTRPRPPLAVSASPCPAPPLASLRLTTGSATRDAPVRSPPGFASWRWVWRRRTWRRRTPRTMMTFLLP